MAGLYKVIANNDIRHKLQGYRNHEGGDSLNFNNSTNSLISSRRSRDCMTNEEAIVGMWVSAGKNSTDRTIKTLIL